jgi:hypothetical protein
VTDVDGTRQGARQRALPQTDALPAPHRRFDRVCEPGYTGRKRGEVVRTRTVVLQAHTHQFLGTFGGPGNGDYRGELRRAIQVITSYATHLGFSISTVLVRLDGLYGDAAPLLDVLSAGLGVIARSRAYHLLDLEVVRQRLLHAPDQVSTHPESGMTRALYDCPAVPLTPAGPQVRLVVATHPATSSSPAVGVERDGTVYELFVSTLPSPAFTASDVLDLYLHRGSFETVLADEDDEQESDRWYSHTPCGQEFAQILAQWIWNLRLELGQTLSPSRLRTTEFAPAREAQSSSTDEPGLVLRSLNPITKETAITARYLRRTSPDPGLSPQVELRGGDASGLLNLLGIGKALPGESVAAEEAPPALLQIEPARSGRDEDVMEAGMLFQPSARLEAIVTGEVIGNHEDVASRVVGFNVGQ